MNVKILFIIIVAVVLLSTLFLIFKFPWTKEKIQNIEINPLFAICNEKECTKDIAMFDSTYTEEIGCVPIPSYPLRDTRWEEHFNKSMNVSFKIPECKIKDAKLEILANCSLQISLYTIGKYRERIDLPYIDCGSLQTIRKKEIDIKEFLIPGSLFHVVIQPYQRGTCFKFDYVKLVINCTLD